MGTEQFTTKLKMIWRIIRANSAHAIIQRRQGEKVSSVAFGGGDLKDMMLNAIEMKVAYDGFMDMINEAATAGGELHTLQDLKAALDTVEKSDGRN